MRTVVARKQIPSISSSIGQRQSFQRKLMSAVERAGFDKYTSVCPSEDSRFKRSDETGEITYRSNTRIPNFGMLTISCTQSTEGSTLGFSFDPTNSLGIKIVTFTLAMIGDRIGIYESLKLKITEPQVISVSPDTRFKIDSFEVGDVTPDTMPNDFWL